MTTTAAPTTSTVVELPLAKVIPSEHNLRKDLGDLSGMVSSIEELGILEPLLVKPHPTMAGCFELVAGERRHAAAKKARGVNTVPCLLRDVDDVGMLKAILVENLQREGLKPLEEALGYQSLIDLDLSQRDIAKLLCCDQSHVSRRVALLKLPKAALVAIDDGTIKIEDAVALGKIADQPAAIETIVKKVKSGARGAAWAPPVDRQVTLLLEEQARESEISALTADLTKKGITIAKSATWKDHLQELGLDKRKHAKEPCHAAVIDGHYGKASVTLICTDPKRHNKSGESALKVKGKTQPQLSTEMEADKAIRAARKQVDEGRLAFCASVLARPATSLLPRGMLEELTAHRYLSTVEDLSTEGEELITSWLGLDLTTRKGEAAHAGTLLARLREYANTSAAHLQRAVLALQFIQAEGFDYGTFPDDDLNLRAHRSVLLLLGYEPHKLERKDFPKLDSLDLDGEYDQTDEDDNEDATYVASSPTTAAEYNGNGITGDSADTTTWPPTPPPCDGPSIEQLESLDPDDEHVDEVLTDLEDDDEDPFEARRRALLDDDAPVPS